MAFPSHNRAAANLEDRRARGDLVSLRDGREVQISRLTPADAPLLAEAFERLSEESRRLRFLGPKASLTAAELRYLTEIDGHNHEALAAIDPATSQAVAIGRFVRDRIHPKRAEVAITVADDWQGQGLGKVLLTRLADRARDEEIQTFTALVAMGNRAMHALLGRLDGEITVDQIGNGVAEWRVELASRGLGRQLEEALRAAAAGHLRLPPRLCEALRAVAPLHLHDYV